MPSNFEIDPSPYHLGQCNAPTTDANGAPRPCGKPAVERLLSSVLLDGFSDQRRCAEHVDSLIPRESATTNGGTQPAS